MSLWIIPFIPFLGGLFLCLISAVSKSKLHLNSKSAGAISAIFLIAMFVAVLSLDGEPQSTRLNWAPGLPLTLIVNQQVFLFLILIPLITLPVIIYSAFQETLGNSIRLIGLECAFAGMMALLVMAGDLLLLSIAWELVSSFSWVLIAHEWRKTTKVSAANYGFNATRLGGFGLWLAAAATLASTGDFSFTSFKEVAQSSWGNLLAAGIILAAISKSAQGPFAPWLFKAMEGPSSVSSLLHSSTMVAAGAWILIRLDEPLSAVPWYHPTLLAIGLATALAGGLVALLQTDIKRLLAASTSAQFGLIFMAIGAGSVGAGLVHLFAHAFFKAALFLVAGFAISATGTHNIHQMQIGKRLGRIRLASFICILALAAVPPMGAAWTKEKIVAASAHVSPWVLVLTIIAGGLSAAYAFRFQSTVFSEGNKDHFGGMPVIWARLPLWFFSISSLAGALLWIPHGKEWAQSIFAVKLPQGSLLELIFSILAIIIAALVVVYYYKRNGKRQVQISPHPLLDNWLGLPAFIKAFSVSPLLTSAEACARLDRTVVDAGVRLAAKTGSILSQLIVIAIEPDINRLIDGLARRSQRLADYGSGTFESLVDSTTTSPAKGSAHSGKQIRRMQDGAIPTYYSIAASSLLALLLILIFWR